MITSSFAFSFLSFLFLNGIVLSTSCLFALAFDKFKTESWSKFLLSTSVFFIAQVFLYQILLGVFSALTYQNVFILALVCFVVAASLFGKRTYKESKFPIISKVDWVLTFGVFGLFIVLFLVRYFNALLQIPLEYDNIAYHLPFAVEWYKTASLLPIYYSAYAGPLGYYPSNFELFDLWVILPFGRDYFVNLLNFPIFPFLILSIYATAKNFKFSSKIAVFVAALFIYMPQTFRQVGVPLVDIFFSFTFVLSAYFLQEFWKSKRIQDLFLFGLSAGYFLGTKYLGLPYVFPLLVVSLVMICWFYWKDKIKAGLVLLWTGFAVTLGGGFWYIRNWVDSGNPLFPVDVSFLGKEIFSGYNGLTEYVLNFSLISNVNSFGKFKEFLSGVHLMLGGQPILFLIAFVLLLGLCANAFYLRFFKRQSQGFLINGLGSIFFVIVLAFYGYFYWKAPYTYNNLIPNLRYAMMFLLVAVFMCGFVASKYKRLEQSFYVGVFLVIYYNMIFLVLNPSPEIILNDRLLIDYDLVFDYWKMFGLYAFLFVSPLFFYWLLLWNASIMKKRIVAGLIVLVFAFGGLILVNKALPKREELREHFEAIWYYNGPTSSDCIPSIIEVAEWLDENVGVANIAYSGFNFHYHLYGREMQRDVSYVNINECLECRYFDYKDSPQSIRRDPNFDNWKANLIAKNKEYLVVAPYATIEVYNWEYE